MRWRLAKREGLRKGDISLGISHVAMLFALYLLIALCAKTRPALAISPASITNSGRISAGRYHTCAMTSSSNAKVKCWGRNDYGQIGNGAILDGPVNPTEVPGVSGVSMIAAGFHHTCALIASDGSIKCWGGNESGQLGDNSTTTRTSPVNVVDGSNNVITGAIIITTGFYHTCAIFSDTSAKCWGLNQAGQLGDSSLTTSTIPVQVVGFTSDVEAISAGRAHTCLVQSSTHQVKCFGDGLRGELGHGSWETGVSTAVTASGISDATDVNCGAGLTCAKLSSGALKCWGVNILGSDSNVPVLINEMGNDTGSVEIGGFEGGGGQGIHHSCAVLSSTNEIVCWGYNNEGQVGDGSNSSRVFPTLVSSLVDAQEVSAGGAHTCAIVLPYAAKCWGDNVWGTLGDGTTTSSNVPVNVLPLGSGTPTPTPTATPSPTPEACSSETSCTPDSSLTTPLNPRSPAFTVKPPATTNDPVAISASAVKLGVPISPIRRTILKSKLQKFLGKKISSLAKAIKDLQVFYVFNIVRTSAASAWAFEEPGDFNASGQLPSRYKEETRKRRVTARLAPGYYAATVTVRIKDSKGRVFSTGKPSAPVRFRVR